MKYDRLEMSKPIPVKLDKDLLARIKAMSKRIGEAQSTVMRIAMRLGLEGLEKTFESNPEGFTQELIRAAASQEPDPEAVAGAVADHLLKRNIVDVVKASSGEAESGASGPGHTSKTGAPASTAGQASAPGQESPSPSGQTKASDRAAKHKRTRSGHKP